jgi:hypothetical protein
LRSDVRGKHEDGKSDGMNRSQFTIPRPGGVQFDSKVFVTEQPSIVL